MSGPKAYRPALQNMGRWKWLSLLLVVFSLVLLVPYFLVAGGSHALSGNIIEGDLGGCPLQLGVVVGDGTVRLSGKMAATCARDMAVPEAALLDTGGEAVTSARFSDNPNTLGAWLRFDSGADTSGWMLMIRSTTPTGGRLEIHWPLTDFTDIQPE